MTPTNRRIVARVLERLRRQDLPEPVVRRCEIQLEAAAQAVGEHDQVIQLLEADCRVTLKGTAVPVLTRPVPMLLRSP
jgi:hypothetical protein